VRFNNIQHRTNIQRSIVMQHTIVPLNVSSLHSYSNVSHKNACNVYQHVLYPLLQPFGRLSRTMIYIYVFVTLCVFRSTTRKDCICIVVHTPLPHLCTLTMRSTCSVCTFAGNPPSDVPTSLVSHFFHTLIIPGRLTVGIHRLSHFTFWANA
jgi:hypothetical protein